MGHVDVAHLSHTLPNGRVLLDDVSFRVGDGTTAALVGPNGAGKTTLIRLIAGRPIPQSGTVAVSGGLGVMRQFVGGIGGRLPGSGVPGRCHHRDRALLRPAGIQEARRAGPASSQLDTGRVTGASPVRDLLISVAPPRVQAAADRLDAAELAMMERDDEPTQMRYAVALAEWGDAGGYDAEVMWDACCMAALG